MQKTLTQDEMDELSERPFTEEELRTAKRVPLVRSLRWRLMMTQEEFAATYGIPLGTLRDWEQRRSTPDATAQAYLKVIAVDPATVAKLRKPAA